MAINRFNNSPIEKRRPLLFQFGLLISLFFTLAAFEWESEYTIDRFLYEGELIDTYDEIFIPISIKKDEVVNPSISKPQVIKTEPVSFNINNNITEPIVSAEPLLLYIEPKAEPIYKEEPLPVELMPEVFPSFPGGDNALVNFIIENIKYPDDARINGITGLVYLQMIVDEYGKVKDVKIQRGIGFGCDIEAIRVVSSMPRWIPGQQGGISVPVQFTIPIHFKLK